MHLKYSLFVSKLFFLSALMLIASSRPVKKLEASCGLAGCPITGPEDNRHLVDQAIRYVTFDIDHHEGSYIQYEPRYEYRGWNKVIVGGFASLITLEDGHESHSGLGNPVLFGQYDLIQTSHFGLAAGTQFELALGNDDDGLAADHTEIVPYLSCFKPGHFVKWMGSLGYRHSLDSSDGHSHGPAGHGALFVNPHEDKEILYRWHAQFVQLGSPWTPELFIDGQHALDGEDEGIGFLSLGGGVRFNMGSSFSVTPKMEFPLTRPRRFDTRVSVHGTLTF